MTLDVFGSSSASENRSGSRRVSAPTTAAPARKFGTRDGAAYAAFSAAALAIFAVAAGLSPNASGIGTHTQIGLPPCLLFAATGYPCPACGMTTAFAHAAHGHILAALAAQPFGAILAAALAAGLLAAPVLAAGRVPVAAVLGWRHGERAAVVGLVLFVLAWAFKIAAVRLG